MKKILFLIPAFLLAFQISKAQTEKGSQTLGVNVSFNTQKTNSTAGDPSSGNITSSTTKFTSFGVGPSYSYFIADKLDIGASLGYNRSSNDNGYQSAPSSQRQHDYSAQLFLRKYFMFGSKLGLRAGPYLGYDRNNSKYTYNYPNVATVINSTKTDNYNGGVNLGLVYYPSKNVGLSATLANVSYSHSKADSGTQGHATSNSFNANFISNNLGLSLFYVFGK
ncbi:autotransporter outer membrane beta-barrel domain-containing protein [Mucilaginibacter sp. FT3.2]|uniref:autotransporter outer membrane beta-barrel domain-containing protein n=1 Tax=Mucilaginibacter sp. FT3.2 TaxID=2723090 RepID=UPI00160D5AB3|nr:autotransporter outer membrane beta-barrel domain-containing protein [Mucilaginibacter sp. FT3.2]MBB6233236.1 hypothetical protein [Mucilaginibacter sp. FT3.2]